MSKGHLISFEGLDGAGKTTQINLLGEWLKERGISYIRTREPGGTPFGVEIRQLLIHRPDLAITPLAEAFLFQADRAQHFTKKILPALEAGIHVVTDRCFDSSIAYQGAARGIGTAVIEQLSLLATQGHSPDLTILLDLDPTLVRARTASQKDGTVNYPGMQDRGELTHFDLEAESFHRRLREAFLALAHAHPERIKVIDASLPPEKVHREIVGLVEHLLKFQYPQAESK